jgi:succinate dehydrogenase (ubiquinone) cytochrome b560 subunit
MKLTGRPVSPHVTIYAFPVTAISSITNRATGMALSVGCAGLGRSNSLVAPERP